MYIFIGIYGHKWHEIFQNFETRFNQKTVFQLANKYAYYQSNKNRSQKLHLKKLVNTYANVIQDIFFKNECMGGVYKKLIALKNEKNISTQVMYRLCKFFIIRLKTCVADE